MYLLTGENTFQLREERRRWIGEFSRKYGEENCGRVDGAKSSVRELLDEVGVQPFLAEKRMVVCEGIPKSTKEEIILLESQIHPDVLLLFIEPKLDKRTAGAKQLLSSAEVKEFTPLKGVVLSKWVLSYSQQQGLAFGAGASDMLIEFIGEDQDMLSQEIQKLALSAHGRSVTKEDIEQMVIPTDEGVIWKISDLLSGGSRAEALVFARRLLDRGGDAYGLWAILLNMLKNLVAVSAAMQAGHSSGKDIADASGVHVFAVRSLQSHARRAKGNELQRFVSWAAGADKDLKTGAFRSTDEAPQELLALIDRFILKCP